MYNNRIKNIELPENLFSNLGEMKVKNVVEQENNSELEFFKENNKFINYPDVNNYRSRINKMYDELNDIKPIDFEINDTLYFDNYIEKGIVVKPKVSSLKQFWTEYRLINNEKKVIPDKKKELNTDKLEMGNLDVIGEANFASFDELFEALSVRVEEINKYIDELKEMKNSISITSSKLEKDKEELVNERQKFYDYKNKEENKLKEERENLKINFSKLQTIINDLDKKLENFDKDEVQ